MKDLISKIRSNKYKSVSDELINQEIAYFLKRSPKAKDKEIIKEVKTRLHKVYGSFQVKKKSKRDSLLEKLKENPKSLDVHQEILRTNVSTKERLDYYPSIYGRIFENIGEQKTILDIGAGINPVSYPFLQFNTKKYTALEINQEDVEFINEYFKIMNIRGKALLFTVNENTIKDLPEADVVFLFKVLDPLERKGHKFSEMLLTGLKCKQIIVSFSIRTISNRKMKSPRRWWFELMLRRLKYSYKFIKVPNEFFYIIRKDQN